MNTYKVTVKLIVTKTITKNVEVKATDASKAKLQLEAMYGKANVIHAPILVK
jgi:hypothetical protein